MPASSTPTTTPEARRLLWQWSQDRTQEVWLERSPLAAALPGFVAGQELLQQSPTSLAFPGLALEVLVGGAFPILQRLRSRGHAGNVSVAHLDEPSIGAFKDHMAVIGAGPRPMIHSKRRRWRSGIVGRLSDDNVKAAV